MDKENKTPQAAQASETRTKVLSINVRHGNAVKAVRFPIPAEWLDWFLSISRDPEAPRHFDVRGHAGIRVTLGISDLTEDF